MTDSTEAELVAFRVDGEKFLIPLSQIKAFPLRSSLVNQLVEKLLDGSFNVDLSSQGEILIERPGIAEKVDLLDRLNNKGQRSCTRSNFGKLVKIYANPKITLFELLELQVVIDLARASEANRTFDLESLLETTPQYNFIRKANYRNFLSELAFYGVLPLFQSSLVSDGIQPELMVQNFHNHLRSFFPSEHGKKSQDNAREGFFRKVLAIGGVFSGSFLLRAALGEDWGENNPNDVDIYVNDHMLEGRFGHRSIESRHAAFIESAKSIENAVKQTAGPDEIDQKAALAKISMPPSKWVEILALYEAKREGNCREKLAEGVKDYFGAVEATVAGSEIDHSYGFTSYIKYVIKVKMENFNVDVVVISSTVPYLLQENFDFDFCKVYYDGYSIHALNWDTVVDKCSVERSHHQSKTRGVTYSSNIARIEKYMKRGFVVVADNTAEYIHHKRSLLEDSEPVEDLPEPIPSTNNQLMIRIA